MGVDYRANADLVVTVSHGTDVSMSLLDDSGNVIDSGLTSLTRERLAVGEHISFDAFTVEPTVNVWHM